MSSTNVNVSLEPVIAATVAGVGVWLYKDSNAVGSVEKCAKTYYSASRHSQNEAFIKCMKSEFPNTFSRSAKSFLTIEEFESS